MSRETSDRIAWTCPECERTYRIPRSRPRPVRCARCAGKQKRIDDDSDVEFAALSSEPASQKPALTAAPTDRGELFSEPGAVLTVRGGASESAAPTREQLDQMIAHLESINRTMKLFRRFLWAIGIVALLNVLLVGASAIYGMSMLGSLFSGGGSGDNGARQNLNLNDQRALNALPPEVRKNLKAVEDYSDTLNELLNEGQ
ncbi:hypothetical protein GC176_06365 [bacterium]|nr:hypothetical protein [bacterium]